MRVAPPPPPRGGSSKEEDASSSPVSRLPRVYQVWKGSNVFFLQGRLIFGPDVRSLFLTIFLIVAPVSVFCIFVARKLMDDYSHHMGISIMVVAVVFTIYDLSLLLVTSGRDPGIIPRNTHPPELEGYDGSAEGGAIQTPQLRLPRMKDVVVNGMTVKVKYCDTCMLYRPPRCSHCSICNNCVEHFDHHCPWVGQCIGLRNYRFFFMFVFSTTLLCIYVFAFSWVYIKRIMDAEETTIWRAMAKTPASIVLILYTFISVWFVGGLSVFHLFLISTNQTTYENFRYRYDGRANPHNIGIIKNFKEIFFSSISPSKNNFRAVVPEELSLPARKVNVGFISPNMGRAMGDLELGRKATWSEAASGIALGDLEAELGNERVDNKDGVLGDLSPDFNPDQSSEITEGCVGMHSRQSSLGRKSGNWEISSDVAQAAGVGKSDQIESNPSANVGNL